MYSRAPSRGARKYPVEHRAVGSVGLGRRRLACCGWRRKRERLETVAVCHDYMCTLRGELIGPPDVQHDGFRACLAVATCNRRRPYVCTLARPSATHDFVFLGQSDYLLLLSFPVALHLPSTHYSRPFPPLPRESASESEKSKAPQSVPLLTRSTLPPNHPPARIHFHPLRTVVVRTTRPPPNRTPLLPRL